VIGSHYAGIHSVNVVSVRAVWAYFRELETLRLLKSSGKTKADPERELGLDPGQIRLWERAFNRGAVKWSRPSLAQDIKATPKLK